MNPSRKTSLIFGLFFAGTFAFSIPALTFYGPSSAIRAGS
jgi:hypothetical protein